MQAMCMIFLDLMQLSDETKANVLSFSDVEDLYEIMYELQSSFTVHLPGRNVDVKKAYDMLGEPVGSVLGKLAERKVSRAIYDDYLVMTKKKQLLRTDVMHLDGQWWFLIIVCEPLQLTLQSSIEREMATVLGIALQGQIELLHSGFLPIRVYICGSTKFF